MEFENLKKKKICYFIPILVCFEILYTKIIYISKCWYKYLMF